MTTDVSTQPTSTMNQRRIAVPTVVALAVTIAAITLVNPSSALAGTWIEVSCPSTSHAAAASPGWSSFAGLSPDQYDGASTVCGDTQSVRAWLSTLEPAHMYDSQTLEFQPPTGSTLDGGWLQLSSLAAGHGPGAYAEVGLYAPSLSGTPFWSCAYEACPQGSKDIYTGQVNIPAETGGSLYVSVICTGGGRGKCQEGEDSLVWGEVEIKEAHLLLSNNATPNATGFGGDLLEPATRGTQELDLTTTDPNGPGVYSITVEIEGTTVYTGVPNTNSGECTPIGTTNGGVLMFSSPQPCLQTEAVELPVETAAVPDGQHSVQVKVTDAAENTTTVFAGNATTHNAPVASTAPTILAPNGVSTGVVLSSRPGQWSAPSGAGTITDVYQWEQCSASGTKCQAIPGGTGATYTPTEAYAGHTLKLAVTALNNDGQATTESSATGIVATATGSDPSNPPNNPLGTGTTSTESTPIVDLGAPNGTGATQSATIQLTLHGTVSRRYSDRSLSIPGKLTTTNGQPIAGATIEVLAQTLGSNKQTAIAHAITGSSGAFIAKIPPGPSRVIELDYRAYANAPTYAAQAKIIESVSVGVTLHVTPRRPSPTGTIELTGQVQGPIPEGGVNLELEVFYHRHWVALHAPRTKPDGRFTLRYQFQGATGQFPFRVKALAGQNGFPYRVGYSNRVDVATR